MRCARQTYARADSFFDTMKYHMLFAVLFCGAVLLSPAFASANTTGIIGHAQVSEGCRIDLRGSCLVARSRPSAKAPVVKRLPIGVMFEVYDEIEVEGMLWYRVGPGRSGARWFVAAQHMTWIGNAPEEPAYDENKKIIVDLSDQKVYAYEGETLVFESLTSTGLPGTPTYPGTFKVYGKLPARYMRGADYDLPGVPWVMYFTGGGAALHGAYWHDQFGHKRSHGCVNLPLDKAEWLYRWTPLQTIVLVQQ